MADNNKVTIDAAWFAELYARWQRKPLFSERMVADGAQAIRENEELRKERDELKAKLEDAQKHYCTNATGKLGDACKVAALRRENEAKLAAAERCIEECSRHVESAENVISSFAKIGEAIRAYREQKEAK